MLAQKTRYALRSLLYLVEEGHGAPVQLARIAGTQRIPPKYLELIMLDLKRAGVVQSVRGPKGGYQLSRDASDISFGEIVRALEGPIALVSCASVNFYAPCGDCHDEATCAIRRAFSILPRLRVLRRTRRFGGGSATHSRVVDDPSIGSSSSCLR